MQRPAKGSLLRGWVVFAVSRLFPKCFFCSSRTFVLVQMCILFQIGRESQDFASLSHSIAMPVTAVYACCPPGPRRRNNVARRSPECVKISQREFPPRGSFTPRNECLSGTRRVSTHVAASFGLCSYLRFGDFRKRKCPSFLLQSTRGHIRSASRFANSSRTSSLPGASAHTAHTHTYTHRHTCRPLGTHAHAHIPSHPIITS